MSNAIVLAKTTEKEFVHCLDQGLGLVTTEGEDPFFPIVTTFTENFRVRTETLIADQISQSILMAAGAIQECSKNATKYGLVWDGYVTIEGVKRDCIFIEYASNTIDTPSEVFGQPYKLGENERAIRLGDTVHMGEWTNRFFVHGGMGLLNKLDWDVLVRAPFVVLCAIAAENGAVNENSINNIVAYLKTVDNVESQSLQAAIEDGVKNHTDIVHLDLIGHDVLSQLGKTCETISWYSQDKGEAFCKGLYDIGKVYAEKYGGDKVEVLLKLESALKQL